MSLPTRWPIFWQVLGLSLAVLVLALGINTFVVLNAPDPPPAGYTLEEAGAALKTGQVELQNGRTLTAVTTATAPDFVAEPAGRGHFGAISGALEHSLAMQLGVPADTIKVHIPPLRRQVFGARPPSIEANRVVMFRREGPGPPPGPDGGAGGEAGFGTDGPGGPLPPPQDGAGPIVRIERLELRGDVVFPPFSAAWKLSDGSYRVITPPQDLIAPWQLRLLIGFGLTALLILPLAWWLSQRLAGPIVAFSEAASKIGVEDTAPPVMAIGPREVRQAADVLNAMQIRIRKQVESRTALMGAIAHDLKTPLARMRLRIEDLPLPLRDKLADDIAHMDGLIRSAMSFTSAHKLGDSLRPLDLSALVETLADDLCAVCEMDQALIEPNIMMKGDMVALKRIVTNLVENAGRYATSCRIELAARGPSAEVRIIDNGPGLPPDQLETVFEPFYRVESSRSRDTGGTGLGLSVARSLAEAQGATLTLHNRYEGTQVIGLEARLVLPRLMRK
ncbi:HAMP domain-containing sensor histidine kinase [Asticcacaulis sp. AC402]|uniref:sensor histidine kinase n=1 Tax=Asticcacaulis sp. AC402 TaxID=1282361 RepID=UPI0003C4021D|nr:HAMP domain-containing sensor histidine kinase [Asticcacaulis sp. AC402]ESQ74376.1 hypothetical protein ABAC402_14695 [Asticcacaulis sp. AC402]